MLKHFDKADQCKHVIVQVNKYPSMESKLNQCWLFGHFEFLYARSVETAHQISCLWLPWRRVNPAASADTVGKHLERKTRTLFSLGHHFAMVFLAESTDMLNQQRS